ncbi:hypothetical protein AAFN86_21770 [Roseomonas sp. CAU 1739]|uniref:hypothetical protein n=1 Tax=Roseomonas sp. CAU 1739 TaxID=3140364 RepID=UPI00325ACBBA
MRILLACLLTLLALPAAAQRAAPWEGICQSPLGLAVGPGQEGAGRAAGLWAGWMRSRGIGTLRIERDLTQQTSNARATLKINLRQPEGVDEKDWRATFFAAIAYPASSGLLPAADASPILAMVHPPTPEAGITPLRVEFTPPETWWRSTWQVAVIACIPNPPSPDPTAFGITEVAVSSYYLSVGVGFGAAALLYLVIAFTALRVHGQQLDIEAAKQRDSGRRPTPAFWRALNPVVICQDAFGAASLSRFQVLLFTLTVVGVYAYVFARTGYLSGLSNTVLLLLGITLAGSTLASLAEGPALATANRVWLTATGILETRQRTPRWEDLLGAEGEVDVTRVQALAFSVFAAVALVVNGATDLENFAIPDQLNTLIGISQAVYVAGKALPREAAKRLNDEVRALRDAEQAVLRNPADEPARLDFERQRAALHGVLTDVFGERFRADRLRVLQPGTLAPA